ncbi:MAG: M1 family metallopeptidase [Cryobacterium sp.]
MPQPRSTRFGAQSLEDPYVQSGNGGYRVARYDLDLDYRVATNRLRATAVISARATMRLDRFSLDFDGLSVERVTVNGDRASKITHTARKLVITVATTIEAGARFQVTVRYRGAPRPLHSVWGDVGWEELDDGVLVAGQPTGAGSWFPCNDHPSDKATFTIAVTCEAPYTVICNGVLTSRTTRSGRTTWTYSEAESMATYLATVQIGRYQRLDVAEGLVPQRIYYPLGHHHEVGVDFARLSEMLDLFTRLFGPYPFATYTVVVTDDVLEIPLESQGLAVFGRNHIDGEHGSDRLIAHELAHQWFGNSLTVQTWRDIWLHEGFACYAEWIWAEASGGRTADDSARAYRRELEALPQDLVTGDPGPHDMFDDRVYKRGALALHAIRRSVGDEAFFDALRAFTLDRRHSNITAEEFVSFITEHTGSAGIDRIVRGWLAEAALPGS